MTGKFSFDGVFGAYELNFQVVPFFCSERGTVYYFARGVVTAHSVNGNANFFHAYR